MNNPNQIKKWSQNRSFIIVLFFLFPPLGVLLMFNRQTAKWKKVIYTVPAIVYLMFILVALFFQFDYYTYGVKYYEKHSYKKAYEYFRKVKPDHVNYHDALNKLQELKPIVDSLDNVSENKEGLETKVTEAQRDSIKIIVFQADSISKAKSKLLADQAKVAQREQRIKNQFSSWDGCHIKLERHIKKIMNDPDSYEHVETSYSEYSDYLIILTKFRGKNAYGGLVLNQIKAKVDLDGNILKIYE